MNSAFRNIVILWVTGTFLWCSSTVLEAALQDELVMYWPLDQIKEGKTPDMAGTNHLTLHNISSTNLVPGKFGNAISFDGSSEFLFLTHSGQRNLPVYRMHEFTIAMWVRGAERQENRMIFAEGAREDRLPLFLLGTHRNGKTGQLNVLVRDKGTILNNIPTDGTAFNNEWRHIAWVNSGNTSKVYINGEMNTEYRYERPSLTLNYLSIGALYRDPPAYFFRGEMDEIAIWERTLSKKEIQQLMNSGLGSTAVSTGSQ